jgi:hypothetical protein
LLLAIQLGKLLERVTELGDVVYNVKYIVRFPALDFVPIFFTVLLRFLNIEHLAQRS